MSDQEHIKLLYYQEILDVLPPYVCLVIFETSLLTVGNRLQVTNIRYNTTMTNAMNEDDEMTVPVFE